MQWLWVMVLGLLAGTGMGYLQSAQEDDSYRSVGKLRLVETPSAASADAGVGLQRGASGRGAGGGTTGAAAHLGLYHRTGELRSEPVLRAAVQGGKIAQLPRFRGKSVEQVVEALRQSSDLHTDVVSVSGAAAILEVSFAAADPTTAQIVVQAIMDAFRQHCAAVEGRPIAGQADPDELSQAEKILAQIESLEGQYVELLRQQELQKRGAGLQASHRRHLSRMEGEQRMLQRQCEQLQGQLAAAREANQQGQPLESLIELLRPQKRNQASATAADVQADAVSQAAVRQLVLATKQRLASAQEQLAVVEKEIATQLEMLRRSILDDAAVAQLTQEIESQHQQYEQALAGLGQEAPEHGRDSSTAERAQCVEMQHASLGTRQGSLIPAIVITDGAIGVSLALLAGLGKQLTRRRRRV